jgi:hypothetical protein
MRSSNHFLLVTAPRELAALKRAPGLPSFDSNDLARHQADAHWLLVADDCIHAHCSLWWRNSAQLNDQRTGVVGHYAAVDAQSSAMLLQHACDKLHARGCVHAVGPMNGSTWHAYRVVTEAGSEPPFFLEPATPPEAPFHWQGAGFLPIAEYSSYLNDDLTYEDPRLLQVEGRIGQSGVELRTLDLNDYEGELRRVYRLACISFRPNFLYTPIGEAEFVQMYAQLRAYIRPELVLMATHGSEIVGFLFSIPDFLQTQRGRNIDTVIIKTVAILPGRAYAGLGNLLAARCHRTAHELGYRRAVHALMHDGNHSRNVSSRYAHAMRRYALYGRTLGA